MEGDVEVDAEVVHEPDYNIDGLHRVHSEDEEGGTEHVTYTE